MSNKFLIFEIEFDDWFDNLNINNHIMCVKKEDVNKFDLDNYLILPIGISNYNKYNDHPNNIFKNNLENIDTVKCLI